MNLFPLQLAKKYVFSGKNAIEVNVISWIAFLALGFVTACLVVVLSVFSGLENVNLQYYSNINPALKILPQKGKTFKVNQQIQNTLKELKNNNQINSFSGVIEEKTYIEYNQKSHIVTLKGVDNQFNQIYKLDTMVKIGNPLSQEFPEEIIIGSGVSSRLSLYPNPDEPVELYVPKPGKGMITSQEKAFNKIVAYSTGIFFINDKYEETVFSQLKLAQELLNYEPNQVSAIEINADNKNIEALKKEIQSSIGGKYVVKTRQELDAAFLKMMNIENLMIYLIFILILVIASFNLAGSIAIIILDKRAASKTLLSMGLSESQLKQTHFTTGILITLYALLFGLIVGGLIALVQQQFALVSISPTIPFPVKFSLMNFVTITASVLFIGTSVSWFVSRYVTFKD